MLIRKLAGGVLALETPIGPRYLQPTFFQRVVNKAQIDFKNQYEWRLIRGRRHDQQSRLLAATLTW